MEVFPEDTKKCWTWLRQACCCHDLWLMKLLKSDMCIIHMYVVDFSTTPTTSISLLCTCAPLLVSSGNTSVVVFCICCTLLYLLRIFVFAVRVYLQCVSKCCKFLSLLCISTCSTFLNAAHFCLCCVSVFTVHFLNAARFCFCAMSSQGHTQGLHCGRQEVTFCQSAKFAIWFCVTQRELKWLLN